MLDTLNLPGFDIEDPTEPQEEGNVQEETQELETEVDETLKAWYEYATSEGLLHVPEDFKFDGTQESFYAAQQKHKEHYESTIRNEILSRVPENNRKIIEAALEGLPDIERVLEVKKASSSIPTLDESDGQEQIIRMYYKNIKKYDDDVVSELIETYKDNGTLKSKASKFVPEIEKAFEIEIENQRQAKIAKEQEALAEAQKLAERINESVKELGYSKPASERILRELYNQVDGESLLLVKLNRMILDPTTLIQLAEFVSYYDGEKLMLDKYRGNVKKDSDQLRSSVERLRTVSPSNKSTRTNEDDVVGSWRLVD